MGASRTVAVGLSVLLGLLIFAQNWSESDTSNTLITVVVLGLFFYLIILHRMDKGWLAVSLAMGCFTLSACLAIDHTLFSRGARTTNAASVATLSPGRGRYTRHFALVLARFADDDGESHVARITVPRGTLPRGKNWTVPVVYHPADPDRGRVSGWLFWQYPLAVSIPGVVLLLIGCLLILRDRIMNPDLPPGPDMPSPT